MRLCETFHRPLSVISWPRKEKERNKKKRTARLEEERPFYRVSRYRVSLWRWRQRRVQRDQKETAAGGRGHGPPGHTHSIAVAWTEIDTQLTLFDVRYWFFFTEFYLIFLFDRLSVSSNDFYLVLPSFFCWFLIVAHALPRALLFFLPSFTDLFVPPSLSRRTVFSWPSNDFYRVLPSFLGGSSLFATLDAGRALDARAKKNKWRSAFGELATSETQRRMLRFHFATHRRLPSHFRCRTEFRAVITFPTFLIGHLASQCPAAIGRLRLVFNQTGNPAVLILPSFTELYRGLPSFTEFYRVVPSCTEFYRVVPSKRTLANTVASSASLWRLHVKNAAFT